MYEVFVNERLALAVGDYQSKDSFESRIACLAAKKGKVGRRVAQVGVKGVSNIAGMLQRTSTFVKVGSCHFKSNLNTQKVPDNSLAFLVPIGARRMRFGLLELFFALVVLKRFEVACDSNF